MKHGFLAFISMFIMTATAPAFGQDVLLQKDICDTVRKHTGSAEIQNNFNAASTQNVVGFPINIPLQLDLQETQFAGFLPDEINTEAILTNLKIHADGSVEVQGENVRFVPDEFCKEEVPESVSRSSASFTTDKDLLSNNDLLSGKPKAASSVPATIVTKQEKAPTKTVAAPAKPAPKVSIVPPKPANKPARKTPPAAKQSPQAQKPAAIVKQDVDLTLEKGEILEGRAN